MSGPEALWPHFFSGAGAGFINVTLTFPINKVLPFNKLINTFYLNRFNFGEMSSSWTSCNNLLEIYSTGDIQAADSWSALQGSAVPGREAH